MRLSVAFRAFFAALFNASTAERVAAVLETPALPAPETKPPAVAPAKPKPPKPRRSEAVTLLATLQRETRFVDLVQESLDQYSDEQVGTAARDVLRGCRGVLDRIFSLQVVVDDQEGATVDVPAGFDAGQFRLTGDVSGEPPLQGRLVHHGWLATRCEIGEWSGSEQSAKIVAPAEVEIG
jgi:hypothetical protein